MICFLAVMKPRAGQVDKTSGIVKNEAIPALSRLNGYQGSLYLARADGKETMHLMMWDSQERAQVWANSGERKKILDGLAAVLMEPVKADMWEIKASKNLTIRR